MPDMEPGTATEAAQSFRCPACGRLKNQDGQTCCARCGVDLSAALRVRSAASYLFKLAGTELPARPGQAAALLDMAWHLRPSREIARALACARLLQKQYHQAMLWRAKAAGSMPQNPESAVKTG